MLLMEIVLTHLQILLNQLILDVEIGIGKIKNVSHALRSGLLMVIMFVCQYQTNAILKMIREIVLHALKGMI